MLIRLKGSAVGLILYVGFPLALIFLWSNGFGYQNFFLSDKFKVLQLVASFLLVGIFGLLTLTGTTAKLVKKKYFWFMLGIIFVVLILSLINVTLKGGNVFDDVLERMVLWGGLFILPLYMLMPVQKRNVIRLNNTLIGIAIVAVGSYIVVLSTAGTNIDQLLDTSGRFGRIRWSSPIQSLIVYAIIYCVVILLQRNQSGRSKAFFYSALMMLIYYILFVDMGRRTILGLVVVVPGLLAFSATKAWVFPLYALLAALTFVVSVVLQFNPLDYFLEVWVSVSTDAENNSGTIGMRSAGIVFFLDQFGSGGYIGLGLVDRSSRGYHSGDHGFYAVIYQFGPLGISLVFLILYSLLKDLSYVMRNGDNDHKLIAQSLILYFIFLVVTGSQIVFNHRVSLYTGLFLYMAYSVKVMVRERVLYMQNLQAVTW